MAKFTGKGAQILVNTATAAPPTYVAFGQIAEIGNIDISADEVEVTTLDAGDYRDYIQGFKDPGEVQITVIFDPGMADQGDDPDGWIGLFTSGETRDWAIRYNSSGTGGQAFGLFKGFIRDFSYGALNPDDPQQIQPTIRLSSPVTLADTLPVTFTAPGSKLSQDEADVARRRAELARMEADIAKRREATRAQEQIPVAA